MTGWWRSTDGAIYFDNRQVNIVTAWGSLFHSWLCAFYILQAGFTLALARVVGIMSCKDKIPWLDGEPREICKLDDPDQLRRFGITLDGTLKKGDYYVHRNNCNWIVVERKDRPSRIEYAIKQLNDTICQLTKQGKPVTQAIAVFEKKSDYDSKFYGRFPNDPHHLFAKAKKEREPLRVHGILLDIYTVDQVNETRQQRRL